MDSKLEQRILQRAILYRIIPPELVQELEREVSEGTRIKALQERGFLDDSTLGRLKAECSDEVNAQTFSIAPQKLRPLAGETGTFVSEPGESLPEFPAGCFGRYEQVEFLEEGGMARVYKAHDTSLGRTVALKFIRQENDEHARRLLQEARSQARIEHKNVCKVYEVGEVEGRPYIAMQFIHGQTLRQGMRKMTLLERVRIMQCVAEGVHSAHEAGLIHRDLKPANIMVEQDDDGSWIPYVMDFGLAREVQTPGLTSTGMVLGSPWYMSPEQARGEVHHLDRRSDVFSLGTTMYEVFALHLPFESDAGMEVLWKVMNDDPVPVRQRNQDVPPDLETIVMKCLEKEPARRYQSARALAEDLQRYLDNEPIQARRASWTYRIIKKAKKHRTVVALLAVALMVAVFFAGTAIRERRQAEEKARLEKEFNQEVKYVEELLRHAYGAPLHDVRKEKEIARTRLTNMLEKVNRAGPLAFGSGHYSIGRGYLAVQEPEKALEHLQKAWQSGYREPEVSYMLGQTLGILYREELEDLRRIGNKEIREARKQIIEKSYRAPALDYLKAAAGLVSQSPAYVEGLISFYEGRLPEALSKTEHALRQVPWLYEAEKLKGDVYLAMGVRKQETGDYDEASVDFKEAGQAYVSALETVRSDPSVYEGLCAKWIEVLIVENRRGNSPEPAFQEALRSCDEALTADPDSFKAWDLKSEAYWRWGVYLTAHGKDPSEILQHCIDAANKAMQIKPEKVSANRSLAIAHRKRAEYEMLNGVDPSQSLQLALHSIREAIRKHPNDGESYNSMGITYAMKAENEIARGLDPRESLKAAIHSYRSATRIIPNSSVILNNLANSFWYHGTYEMGHGTDPRKSFQQAIPYYKESLRINPNYSFALNNAGVSFTDQAKYEMSHGIDPTSSLNQAFDHYQRSVEVNPEDPYVYNNLGGAFWAKAVHERDQGLDPTKSLEEARRSLERHLQINPDELDAYINIGNTWILSAEYELQEGKSPMWALQQARTAITKALAISPDSVHALVALGQLEIVSLRRLLPQRSLDQAALDRARQILEKAIQTNSQNAECYYLYAELCRLESEWRSSHRQPAAESISNGLQAIQKALSINPDYARAYLTQAALLIQASKVQKEEASEILSRAWTALEKAGQINPALESEILPLLPETES